MTYFQISAHDATEDRQVICVYTKDFCNYDEVKISFNIFAIPLLETNILKRPLGELEVKKGKSQLSTLNFFLSRKNGVKWVDFSLEGEIISPKIT